jgi:hypothetical protein
MYQNSDTKYKHTQNQCANDSRRHKKARKSPAHPRRKRRLLVDINTLRHEIRRPHEKIICLGAQQLDESADDVLAKSYALALDG